MHSRACGICFAQRLCPCSGRRKRRTLLGYLAAKVRSLARISCARTPQLLCREVGWMRPRLCASRGGGALGVGAALLRRRVRAGTALAGHRGGRCGVHAAGALLRMVWMPGAGGGGPPGRWGCCTAGRRSPALARRALSAHLRSRLQAVPQEGRGPQRHRLRPALDNVTSLLVWTLHCIHLNQRYTREATFACLDTVSSWLPGLHKHTIYLWTLAWCTAFCVRMHTKYCATCMVNHIFS